MWMMTGVTGEATPTADRETRVMQTTVDQGAYEMVNIDTTTSGSETSVDINDLLALIGQWGPCPPPSEPCIGDICDANGDCGGDGVVDIDDLLEVLGSWGECGGTPETFPGGLNDCFNVYCTGLSGAEWQECLTKCFEAFCEARPQECD